jgi:hypothetical protein
VDLDVGATTLDEVRQRIAEHFDGLDVQILVSSRTFPDQHRLRDEVLHEFLHNFDALSRASQAVRQQQLVTLPA